MYRHGNEAHDGIFLLKPLYKREFWALGSQTRMAVFFGGDTAMLTDAAIKALRAKGKMYKVADRNGMYVRIMPSGTYLSGWTIG